MPGKLLMLVVGLLLKVEECACACLVPEGRHQLLTLFCTTEGALPFRKSEQGPPAQQTTLNFKQYCSSGGCSNQQRSSCEKWTG